MRFSFAIASFFIVFINDLLAIPTLNFEDQSNRFQKIQIEAEEFYKTISLDLLNDAKLNVQELVQKYGYPCETHTITSLDGYVLNMHRIPYGRDGPSSGRPTVFLQHGLLSSSADWVIVGPEKALGYALADAGYDVWMSNIRGNKYGRNNTYLDPDRNAAKFWDFSWHEIALRDLPVSIDYVIDQTGQETIYYIGHSQGTTIFYVLCSEKPEYNKKVRAQFSLAPVGYMGRMTSPLLRLIALAEGGLEILMHIIGMYEFLPNTGFIGQVGDKLCGDNSIFQILCTNTLFAICGFNTKQMNATLLPVLMGHTPAGAATKQLLHYAQEINSGRFRQWDYGIFGNLKHYGSISPPKYKLKKVTAPVYLHYSRNDWLSHERDVLKLYKELGNVRGKFLVPDNKFNHLDYMFGIEANDLVYRRIIGLMRRH